MKNIYVATIIACTFSIVLGFQIVRESCETWGHIQWVGYHLIFALMVLAGRSAMRHLVHGDWAEREEGETRAAQHP